MASSHNNTHTDAAKMEQIITEFFSKSLQIILESRAPYMSSRNYRGEQNVSSPSSSSSSSSVRTRDKWFNLALRECPAALDNIDLWHQNNLEPMVVDVILAQRPVDWDPSSYSPKRNFVRNFSSKELYPFSWSSDQEELGYGAKTEKIIERWVVQYESRKPRDSGSGSRRSSNTVQTLYKKSILLLRSLYVTVRLLPAFKIFCDLNSSGQIRTFTLSHRVSSFFEPFTRKEESEMQQFAFTPVETSCGRLCLSVIYRSSFSDISSELSTPMSPQFIPDYVGSPLAYPLKRFPLLPGSHGSPSSLPFSRPHSWSYDRYKASPPSISFSLSPTHSEPHASVSNRGSRRFPSMNLPPHPPETPSVHKKNTSFDDYCPSPQYTPSQSPSPPICIPGAGSHISKAFSRCESAPVRIPTAMLATSPVSANKQNLPPSPVKGIRSGYPKTDKGTDLVPTGLTLEKLYSLGKDSSKNYSSAKLSSNGSPQISFSRSPRSSFQDDVDDTEFPGPFDVEDDDMMDLAGRPGSFDQNAQSDPLDHGRDSLIRKSQDAAIGALVCMLKKAPPLRQGFSSSGDMSQDCSPKRWSGSFQEDSKISEAPAIQHGASLSAAASGLIVSKTTADALAELQGYKVMKDLLLNRSGRLCIS